MARKGTSKPKARIGDHSSGAHLPADVAAQHTAQGTAGALLHQAMNKSKSTGLTGKKR